jgi:hypothetical protein
VNTSNSGSNCKQLWDRLQPVRTGAVEHGSRGHCWDPLPGNA